MHPAEFDPERRGVIDLLSLTDSQMEDVLARLRADRFADLSDDERAALGLQGLDAESIKSLQEDRIEAIRDDKAIRTLQLGRVETLGDDAQLLAARLWRR